MSDLTPNTPYNEDMNKPVKNDDSKYELITAYIDNELSDSEADTVKKLIEKDNDFYNRYIFEKLTKENFQKRNKKLETPLYVYQNIGKGIDDYIRETVSQSKNPAIASKIYNQQINLRRSGLRRYLLLSSVVMLILVSAAFLFNNYLKKNPDIVENDLVSVSRNIFDKVESGQIPLQFKSDNAHALEDSMDKKLDFEAFVPDVKDAILLGGVCNEINGQKIAHIIHKKGDIIIYTLEACKKDIINNDGDKLCLSKQFKENVTAGKNWFYCNKDKNKTAVIWYKDNVICSTISAMDYQDITNILTNYK